MATQPNIVDLASAVADRLGNIKAQIAELKKIEADLIERLIISGETAIDGSLGLQTPEWPAFQRADVRRFPAPVAKRAR